jgi:small nuclear ribonucleoprotein (snRNP)-like protein
MILEKLLNKRIKVIKKDGYAKVGILVDLDPLFVFLKSSSKIEAIAKDSIERIEVLENEQRSY